MQRFVRISPPVTGGVRRRIGAVDAIRRDRLGGKPSGSRALDPKILLALGLCARVDGMGSARQIEWLTQVREAYR